MKNKILLVLCGLCALCVSLFGQDASPITAAPPAADWITSLVTGLVGSHPWVSAALLTMGALRAFFKPLMTGVENYVKSTPYTGDDAFLEKVEHSRVFKAFAWALDFFGSIKLGPQFTAKPGEK
ncbi:MAG: hypothetical protein HZA93_23780 [Verrucomicrobia bacterium]|nr:hypothetical protein [Verrucomicrobiota bacterium]